MMNLSYIHNRKVVIIGAGNVGASIAYSLTIRNLAQEIVLIDKDAKRAVGEAQDIQHGIPYMGVSSVRCGDYSDCKNSDIVIITVGRNRQVGETRLDLAKDNIDVVKDVCSKIKPYYNRGVILIVANPVDVLTFKCTELMDLPDGRIFGTGNLLDISRLVRIVGDYTRLNTEMIRANIVGEHGDEQIPIWSALSIAGIPIDEYCDAVNLEWNSKIKSNIEKSVRELGSKIIKGKGKTHYGIATCVCYIADAILNQRLTIMPVTSVLHGEYGVSNVSLSVPSIVGVNGVEKRIEERWSDLEHERFKGAAKNMERFLTKIY